MKKIIIVLIVLLVSIPLSAQQEANRQPPTQQSNPNQAAQTQPQTGQKKSLEEERLGIVKEDIKKELEQLRKIKKEIEDLQKLFDQKLEQKDTELLAQVAKIYESMQADEAAKRLEKLDDDTAVTIIVALKPKTAGRILAQIEESRAATLSKKILARAKVKAEKPTQ